MSEFGPLYDLAAATLGLLEQGFVAADVDLPDRRTVIPGATSVWDCEQATVSVVRVAVGIPGRELGAQIRNCPPLRFTTLRIEIVRCTPTQDDQGDPPTAQALDASARQLLRDMDVMDRTARTWQGLAEFGGPGVPIAMAGAVPVEPQGGLAASRLDLDVALLSSPA